MGAEDALRDALCAAVDALSEDAIDALVVGGIALSHHLDGQAVVDHDVDLLIRESDLDAAMTSLSRAGFEVVQTHPTWLFKARLDGAMVDVLYRLGRILSLDDEMLERATKANVDGCTVPIISREDLAIGQAGASSSDVHDYWFQAVALLHVDVDWNYVSRRGQAAPDRITALLHYVRSDGVDVPSEAFPASARS